MVQGKTSDTDFDTKMNRLLVNEEKESLSETNYFIRIRILYLILSR